MANLGDYSSLIQLGFGIGIGLSVFEAPFNLIRTRFDRDCADEFDVVENLHSIEAKTIQASLADLRMDAAVAFRSLNRINRVCMILACVAAIIDLATLIAASHNATHPLQCYEEFALVFLNAGVFVILGGITTWAALSKLRPLRERLNLIRTS